MRYKDKQLDQKPIEPRLLCTKKSAAAIRDSVAAIKLGAQTQSKAYCKSFERFCERMLWNGR